MAADEESIGELMLEKMTTTAPTLEGHPIEQSLGIVRGITVR